MNTLEKIKHFSQGQSVTSIGKASGVSAMTIYRWNHQQPSLKKLIKVAQVLGIDYRLLLPDEEFIANK